MIRAAYRDAIGQWFRELDEGCLVRDIDRVALATDDRLDRALYDYLHRRSSHY